MWTIHVWKIIEGGRLHTQRHMHRLVPWPCLQACGRLLLYRLLSLTAPLPLRLLPLCPILSRLLCQLLLRTSSFSRLLNTTLCNGPATKIRPCE